MVDFAASAEPYISTVHYRVPFDVLWGQLSNPLNFPRLYPRWTQRVERRGPETYLGVGPAGVTFTITPRLNREHGVIDFEVAAPGADSELSRSRVFPLKDGSCLYVHVAVRWTGLDDGAWAAFKQDTDSDLENAQALLEREVAQPT